MGSFGHSGTVHPQDPFALEIIKGSFPVFVQNQPETFDANTAFFDNTTLTFDRVSGDGS